MHSLCSALTQRQCHRAQQRAACQLQTVWTVPSLGYLLAVGMREQPANSSSCCVMLRLPLPLRLVCARETSSAVQPEWPLAVCSSIDGDTAASLNSGAGAGRGMSVSGAGITTSASNLGTASSIITGTRRTPRVSYASCAGSINTNVGNQTASANKDNTPPLDTSSWAAAATAWRRRWANPEHHSLPGRQQWCKPCQAERHSRCHDQGSNNASKLPTAVV